MTAHFHSKIIPHVTHEKPELCYQPKHVLDDDLEERTTVFCRQRKLHLDAGYDPHPEVEKMEKINIQVLSLPFSKSLIALFDLLMR